MPMFLFTTPNTPQAAPASPVVDAIRQGADRTGAEFEYLLTTAQRESSLDPSARARTSSATGLFQFIEQTWLAMIKKDGQQLGLGEEARQISRSSDGTYRVTHPAARREILALREDPAISSSVAGAFTQRNREVLAGALTREPRPAELYIAHFLGAGGAVELIRQAGAHPNASAAEMFPEAAKANRSIFFDRAGAPRGAGEVYGLLASYHASTTASAPSAAGDVTEALVKIDGPAFHGLFHTGGRTGAISDAVANLWSARSEREGEPAPAARFFPGSRPHVSEDVAASDDPTVVAPPIPPGRPAAAASVPVIAPLDLTKFMHWRRSS
jgi:hypothetical protein